MEREKEERGKNACHRGRMEREKEERGKNACHRGRMKREKGRERIKRVS